MHTLAHGGDTTGGLRGQLGDRSQVGWSQMAQRFGCCLGFFGHGVCGCAPLEFFKRCEIAPLANRQIAQHDLADPHSLEAHHLEAHQLAHAANLAFFAFGQYKTQLLGVLPFDLGWLEWLAVQA